MDFPHYLFPSVSDMDASVVDLSAVREVAEVGAPGCILESTSLDIYAIDWQTAATEDKLFQYLFGFIWNFFK